MKERKKEDRKRTREWFLDTGEGMSADYWTGLITSEVQSSSGDQDVKGERKGKAFWIVHYTYSLDRKNKTKKKRISLFITLQLQTGKIFENCCMLKFWNMYFKTISSKNTWTAWDQRKQNETQATLFSESRVFHVFFHFIIYSSNTILIDANISVCWNSAYHY